MARFNIKEQAQEFRALFEKVNADSSAEEYMALTMANLDDYAMQYYNLSGECHSERNCLFMAWAIINEWF